MGRKPDLIPHHRAHLFVHTGDRVKILTGKDRGETGRVVRTFPRSNRVIVEGKNIAKRHMRPTQGQPGGMVDKAMPLNASNVMVICTECNEPTRVAHDRVPQGQDLRVRVRRICKKCGKPITEQSRAVRE